MTIKRKDLIFIAILALIVCETVQGDRKLEEWFTSSILNFKKFMLEWVSSTHFLIYLLFFLPCLAYELTKALKQ